jgi:hypothetical protein
VIDSLPYTNQHFYGLDTPYKLFNRVKPLLTYRKDPEGLELLQSVPSLMDPKKNWHKIAGAGDCDCFTLLTLAILSVNPVYNHVDKFAVLVGNNADEPSHIYSAVKWHGKLVHIDFTNPAINIERPYLYRQYVPFNL